MSKKHWLTVLTAGALLTGALQPAASAWAVASSFNDINGSYAKDAIQSLMEQGIITGKGNGSFDPTGRITREDFAIILAKALQLDISTEPAAPTFSDVPTTHYAYKYIEAAVKAGLIEGMGNGAFGLTQNLTREQMAALFVRALGEDVTGSGDKLVFSDSSTISGWAKDAVGHAVEIGLMNGVGNGSFNPAGGAERQAVALVASRFLEHQKQAAKEATAIRSSALDSSHVSVEFSAAISGINSSELALVHKSSGAAVPVAAVVLNADRKSASLTTAQLEPSTTYTVTFRSGSVDFTTPVAGQAVKLELTASSTETDAGSPVSLQAKAWDLAGYALPQETIVSRISWQIGSGGTVLGSWFTGSSWGTVYAVAAKLDQATASVSISTRSQPAAPSVPVSPPADPVQPNQPDQPPGVPEQSDDTRAPILTNVTVTGTVGAAISGMSDEAGSIYLVFAGAIDGTLTKLALDGAVAEQMAAALPASADTPVTFDTGNWAPGSYLMYAVDAAGNISSSASVALTAAEAIDTAPSFVENITGDQTVGATVYASIDEAGTIYLVPFESLSYNTAYTVDQLEAKVTSGSVKKAAAAPNTRVTFNTLGSPNDTYWFAAVDSTGNLSAEHPTFKLVGVYFISAASGVKDLTATPTVDAKTSVPGTLYLMQSTPEPYASKDALDAAVSQQKGVTQSVEAGNTVVSVSTSNLSAGTYTWYLVSEYGQVTRSFSSLILSNPN